MIATTSDSCTTIEAAACATAAASPVCVHGGCADRYSAPRDGKLAAMATLERTAEARDLSEDELLSWMGAVNDFRLVLGTRIDITEEAGERDYPPDHPDHDAFQVYGYLTWLEDGMLRALGEPGPTAESVDRG